jgi:hypothetical protein
MVAIAADLKKRTWRWEWAIALHGFHEVSQAAGPYEKQGAEGIPDQMFNTRLSQLWPICRTVVSNYMSSGANCENASGAASSNRVNRLRKTNFTISVGPFRCLAIRSSVSSLSSGVAPALKKCGR